MIRYKRNIFPSKKLPYKYLYTIVSRNSVYGIHKHVHASDITKTELILFIEESVAVNFVNYIDTFQKENIEFDRICLEKDNVMYSPATNLKSTYPLTIQKNTTRDLELTCIMKYFDMFIVSKIEKEEDLLNVYGFQYSISDLPCRTLIDFDLKYDS